MVVPPMRVKTQPADCSLSQEQDSGIGLIDLMSQP